MSTEKNENLTSDLETKKSLDEELLSDEYSKEKKKNINYEQVEKYSQTENENYLDKNQSYDLTFEKEKRPVQRKGSLKDDAIEEKKGNYIISFGRAKSGKTTFQSFLLYYLTHSNQYKSNLVISPEETATGWDAQRIYNEWMSNWQDGVFPRATAARENDIRELTISVKPKTGNLEKVDFSFLEISGELMEKIMPSDDTDPILIDTLIRYLKNENINYIFYLFIDPQTASEDDILFDNLFSFLKVNFSHLFYSMSLGIVISKPEESLKIFKKSFPGYSHYVELKGDLCEDYIERMTPRLFQTLNSWDPQNRVQIMTMSLGEYDENDTQLLIRKEFYDIDRIFRWAYKQFTGQNLGLNWWQKFIKWIKE